MKITNFYEQILGIEAPWQIVEAKIESSDKSVHIYLDHPPGSQFCCKHCNQPCSVYDHGKERIWRHLDTCDHYTYLHACLPRVKCAEHGIVTIEPSWSRGNSRFTLQFESFIIDTLQSTQVRSRAAIQLRVSEEQLKRIQIQAVERGLNHRKSLKEESSYVSLLYDGQTGAVLEVVEHRTEQAAQNAFTQLGQYIDLQHVQVVTMDMWKAFQNAAEACIPQADIVHDRLKGTKYLWLKNPNDFTENQQHIHDQLMEDKTLKTVEAWTIKEDFKQFFDSKTVQQATDFFNNWVAKVKQSQNARLLNVAKTFENHLQGLLDYTKHRVSNAMAECMNMAIQQIKSKARGFKSAKAFRIAILFHLGNLEVYP